MRLIVKSERPDPGLSVFRFGGIRSQQMDLYGQDAEYDLLARVLTQLSNRSVLDIGAEKGGFTEAMLAAGCMDIHAFEPEPRNAEGLRELFGGVAAVTIHECAIGDADASSELHVSSSPDGEPVTFGHSLAEHADAEDIVWRDRIPTQVRSLGSLVEAGEIPQRVGIVKIDTEGNDLAVVGGLGELDCDVIMTEHWVELPRSLGRCPWTVETLLAALAGRGFRDYAFFVHRGAATIVQWNDATVPPGFSGNLVFLHERVRTDLLPLVLESASTLARQTAEAVDKQLSALQLIDQERQLQTIVAQERVALIESVEQERDVQAAIAAERSVALAATDRERVVQAAAAEERLRMIKALEASDREEAALLGLVPCRETVIPDDQHDLADLVRAERATVERALMELAAAMEPPDPRLSVVLLGSTIERLAFVEERLRNHALRHNGPVPTLPRLRYQASRIRMLAKPRLGRLRHYSPRELMVPASYLREPIPEPPPKISIITPSFGQGRFLERTLQSVLNQGYPDLEYFIQDGGSTDESVEILDRYDSKLTGWVSETDGGQADAINRGFTRTTGEIMGWLNSDDLLLPGSLAYVATYFAAHPEVDVVYGNRVLIDDDDRQIGAWVLPAHDDFALTLADFVPQETLFWRRRVWEAAGSRLDPRFGYALDWDLLLRFREVGATMVRLPRFLGAFRIHEDQKTLASHPLGMLEMERLRERVHGRAVSIAEVNEGLQPYLRRHVILHLKQRVIDRLPLARASAETLTRTAGEAPVLSASAPTEPDGARSE
jgi:FkbM family methyltransferase